MIIEKVSRSGIVLEHFQFNAETIRIGRAYDNDLILHDVHVDGSHLKLSYDDEREGFWFEDLGTTNGTQVVRGKENRHKRVPANFISSGDTLCVGKTWLKVRSRVQDVPAAIKISVWDRVLSLSGSIWTVTILCLTLVCMESLNQFLNDPRTDKLGSKILESFDLIFIIIVYGVVWAFIARVQKMEPRLLVHASLVAWCLLIIAIFDLVEPIIYFNLLLTRYSAFFNLLVNSICMFAIVWISLYLATELKKVLRFLLAILIPFGLSLSLLVGIIQKPEFRPFPEYDSLVVAPEWQWREGLSHEEFIQASSALYIIPERDDEKENQDHILPNVKMEIEDDLPEPSGESFYKGSRQE